MAGYRRVSQAEPGATHRILAALQRGWHRDSLDGALITQNVDGLHARAGSDSVLELHGTIHRVGCLQCGVDVCRAELQAEFERHNNEWMLDNGLASEEMMSEAEERGRTFQRPDGDTEIPDSAYDSFRVPKPCLRPSREWSPVEQSPSGGIISAAMRARRQFEAKHGDKEASRAAMTVLQSVHHADAVGQRPVGSAGRAGCAEELMPRVVFHGGTLPPAVTAQSMHQASNCDGMVVLGSTLSTFSALRLVRAAHNAGAKIVIVNHGATRADGLADACIDGDIASVLQAALGADWGPGWLQSRLARLPDPLPSPADAIAKNARR
jgi:NAD-dependent deacetylase sirtuin 4